MAYLLGIGAILTVIVLAIALSFAASIGLRRLLPPTHAWQPHFSHARSVERATFLLKNIEPIGVLLVCALMVAIGVIYS